ncbi:MAG: glycosyltransferase family 2 protein [Xanthobacteraceae bacterium]
MQTSHSRTGCASPEAEATPESAVAARFINDRVAVLIPCYNEAATIGLVVEDFRRYLPSAAIYVYDNNSTDDTVGIARAAGAEVRHEYRQGKGHVVRRMFADIDADVYLLVDGDATYDPSASPAMVDRVLSGPFDKVNGARVHSDPEAYRLGHILGNRLLTRMVSFFFGEASRDMLSGYKALSRRFVKTFPAASSGFEIETELLVHALELGVPMSEIDIRYYERPAGSVSKLSTYRDGLRILRLIVHLLRDLLPLQFFTSIAVVLAALAAIFGIPVIAEFLETGLVPRFPTLIAASATMIMAFLSVFAGLILDSVARGRKEAKLLAYLSYGPARR